MTLRTVVGWFAILAGLVLTVHGIFVIQHTVETESLTTGDYVRIGLRVLMALAGLVLIIFGLVRLKRRDPPRQVRKPLAHLPGAHPDEPNPPV
jgi:hypothetical protein